MEIFDVALRLLAVLGLPTVLMFWLKDRRRVAIANGVSEQKTPYEIRATAATTLDVEVAALQKTFDVAQSARNDTIAYLKAEVVDARLREAEKDARNDLLQATVTQLQARVVELQATIADLQINLNNVSVELEAVRRIAE
jgi:seryl-tRNA synthetase